MPEAGVPTRARRRNATPWWDELDRDAFRFPTGYELEPAPRTVARAGADQGAAAASAVAVAERVVATPGPGVTVAGHGVAATEAVATPGPTPPARPAGSAGTRAADGERRTVIIRGRGAERNLPVARPTQRRHERPGFKADRAALWAVMLGLLLILVAATSAHAAILH
jgi:hypothetical protein